MRGVDDLVDHKGPNEAKSQFPGVDLEEKIPRSEPDPLARHIGQGWGAVLVGLPLGLQRGAQEDGMNPSPHIPAAMQVGAADFFSQRGVAGNLGRP